MKSYIFLLIITLSLSFQAQNINLKKVHNAQAKVGLLDYPIDTTTLPEIIADFGKNYVQVPNRYYINGKVKEGFEKTPPLIEIKYKTLGVSFYYLGGDNTQTIKAVRLSKPFKVKTKTNIILGKSKLGDVLKLYNDNTKISISITNNDHAVANINRYNMTSTGISFSSKMANHSKDNFPYKDEELENLIIDEVYISNINYLNRILLD